MPHGSGKPNTVKLTDGKECMRRTNVKHPQVPALHLWLFPGRLFLLRHIVRHVHVRSTATGELYLIDQLGAYTDWATYPLSFGR
jgi:hypothetical protein